MTPGENSHKPSPDASGCSGAYLPCLWIEWVLLMLRGWETGFNLLQCGIPVISFGLSVVTGGVTQVSVSCWNTFRIAVNTSKTIHMSKLFSVQFWALVFSWGQCLREKVLRTKIGLQGILGGASISLQNSILNGMPLPRCEIARDIIAKVLTNFSSESYKWYSFECNQTWQCF